MQVREIEDDGLPVLLIAGEIDLHRSPELRAVFQTHVKARTSALVVDLTAVEYIDSPVWRRSWRYLRSAQDFSGRIALVGLSPRVRTIFDLVRLGEIIPIAADLAEARAKLHSPPA